MGRIHSLLCLVLLCVSSAQAISAARLFDACPSRRISIGACLAGLCPSGSECINNFCCKMRKNALSTTTPYPEEEETNIYGKCVDGRNSIGECVEGDCPDGFICERGLCCLISGSTFPRRFTMTPPTTKLTTTTVTSTSSQEKTTVTSAETFPPDSGETTGEESSNAITSGVTGKKITTEEEWTKENKKGGGEDKEESEVSTTTQEPEDEYNMTPTTYEPVIEETSTTRKPTTTTTPEDREQFACPIGQPIGECVSGQCPEGHTCYNGNCCVSTPEINCTDSLPTCARHLCQKRGYKDFMTKNCARTCARCHIPIGDRIDCRDRRADCAEWASEGFCSSTLYTTQQKMKFCGKSCNLC